MKKTITILGALSATFLAFACDEGGYVPPGGVVGSGGAATTGSGGAATTGTPGSGGAATTDATGSGGAAAGEEALLDSANPTWVSGAANTFGIQGAFFVLEDSMKDGVLVADTLLHTDLTPDTFDGATTLCVTGSVPMVTSADGAEGCDASGAEDTATGCQWSAQWGGGIGLNLNETGETAAVEATTADTGAMDAIPSVQSVFDATAAGVTGFSFTLSGAFDGTVRFKAKMEGSDDDFCAEVFLSAAGTTTTVLLSDLHYGCWAKPKDTDPQLDLTKLTQIQWQLVSSQEAAYPVASMCVTSLGAL